MKCYLCEDQRYERFANGEDRPCSACNEAELREYQRELEESKRRRGAA